MKKNVGSEIKKKKYFTKFTYNILIKYLIKTLSLSHQNNNKTILVNLSPITLNKLNFWKKLSVPQVPHFQKYMNFYIFNSWKLVFEVAQRLKK